MDIALQQIVMVHDTIPAAYVCRSCSTRAALDFFVCGKGGQEEA